MLAKKFKTSQMVARKAFERLQNEGLIETRHGSGTYIREQKPSVKSVAILNEVDISHPDISYFYTRIIQQLRLFFDHREIPAILYLGHNPPNSSLKIYPSAKDSLVKDIEKGMISGIISVSGPMTDEWQKPLIESGVPIVGFNPCFSFGIDFDAKGVIKKGIEILLMDGCRKPMIITSVKNYFDYFISIAEEKDLASKNMFPAPKNFPGNEIQGFGYSSVMEIFGRNLKPDGLLFIDDMIFKNAMLAILELGLKVPEELQIVTHSNRGSGMFIPFPVTFLEIDPDLIAEKYGLMLLDMLEGREMPRERLKMPFEVVTHNKFKI